MWVSGFKNACWNHITRHPSKIRGNSLFMVSKHGCNFKNIWRGRSRAAVSLKAIQQRWMFVWKASHCSAAVYSYILFYMPVVLSLGISSASQTFFFTATSQAPPLWHFIYITISRIQGLERFCTNKIKIALTDWSVQWMWDWHTLKGQTSEHTV